MSENSLTRSMEVNADIVALLRARNSVIWIVSKEEARVERYLFEAASSLKYITRTWDAAQGVADINGIVDDKIGGTDAVATLTAIGERANNKALSERGLWIMRDLPVWLQGPIFAPYLRKLRNLYRSLPEVPSSA